MYKTKPQTKIESRPLRAWTYHPDLVEVAALIEMRTGEIISPYEAMDYTVDWLQDIQAYKDGVQYYIDKSTPNESKS